tara:strand:- start:43980 stop:46364 length:2385 start_codon:yes stop_codon:yes gene_type:complete
MSRPANLMFPMRNQVIDLARNGMSMDQIAQITAQPPEVIQALLADSVRGSNDLQSQQNFGIVNSGLDSTITEMAGGVATSKTNQLEANVADTMRKTLDIDNEKPESEMTFVDKLNQAMTLGTAKRDGEEVTQSGVDTYSTMDKINRFYGVDPESQADANKIYLDAFKEYLDTDDIKKLVPQPDKALPYLAAGAALINSGTKGDDWGTALSNAFLNYASGSAKEKKQYQDAMASIDINKAKRIQDFSANLMLSSAKERNSLRTALIKSKREPYTIPGQEFPEYLTDQEVSMYPGAVPYSGEMKAYTIYADVDGDGKPDPSAGAAAGLYNQQTASRLANQGFIVTPGHDSMKGRNQYMIEGKIQSLTDFELQEVLKAKPGMEYSKIGTAKVIQALNSYTGRPEFTLESNLIGGKNKGARKGYEHLVPLTEDYNFTYGANGEISFQKGRPQLSMAGSLTIDQANKQQQKIEADLQSINTGTRNILNTTDKIFTIIDDARARDQDVTFGNPVTGLTQFGKNVIGQFEQLNDILDSGQFDYFNDANNNGKRDPGEQVTNPSDFRNQFNETFEDTGIYDFLKNSGLDTKRVQNLIFTLALQSAALDNQKGRDISDKDIERFLNRAGANASTFEDFEQQVYDLVEGAVDKYDGYVMGAKEFNNSYILDPSEAKKFEEGLISGVPYEPVKTRFIDTVLSDENMERYDSIPINRGSDKSINTYRDLVKNRDRRAPSNVGPGTSTSLEGLPQGAGTASGIGTMSNEELYQRLVSQPTLGATYQTNYPDAYEQFKNYLKVRAQIQ